ncbi:putative bifunctional diguanylate cyclase/phosphodiesterase [Mesorhizobium sp. 1B3]|uniref:putative bifunctional diguanylate cyclase/phosphodiesterase n=1 Tax=Mesorhizobium sp. 1B3 TaxID=3243599 RepID=UPI003D97F17A
MGKTTENHIPDDVYIQFVRSLFNSAYTVLVGAAIHALLAFMGYWTSGYVVYVWLAVTLLAVGVWRFAGMRKFRRATPLTTREEASRWEREYILRGTVQAFVIGLFGLVALTVAPIEFVAIAAACALFGSIVTVAGRNYGSSRMVAIFSAAFLAPFAIGLVLRGDVAHVLLGLTAIPYYFIIKSTADQIRQVLFSAVIGHKQARQIAQRFDRALNTMPHGLVMLDNNGRVVVANAEAAHLMAMSSPEAVMGRTIEALLMRGVAAGVLDMRECRYAVSQLTRSLREGRDRKVMVPFADGRHFEFSTREGRDELSVITFEDVTQRAQSEEKIRTMARFDNLTGLPNRAYLHELVSEYMASGDRNRLCGLAVFDLDDFKSVNDTLGHPVGDGLIYAAAERLGAFKRSGVEVSRFGGDEFMIYFDRIEDDAHMAQLLDEIFAGLQGEVDVAGHSLRIQASAGAVLSRVEDTDVDAMTVKADLALYTVKELGKNGWRLFETTMDEAFRNKQLLKADLRNAIGAKALRVVYQPIVDMASMRIACCEALCRWDHPDLGPISPAIFIPLAEEMGIVSEISAFMLSAATKECAKWPEPINVAINLSAKDFRNRDIVDKVRNALAESGLASHRLEIEVTETALLDDKSLTRELIEEMKTLGVRIALDDFGTGYSSLSYLHKLPLDKIKIDRSFLIDVTQNERSLELLKGVVNLSRPLGLQVTVEGVETFEQFKVLALTVKPDLVQGFLFGSALSASGIETMSTTVWPFVKDIRTERLTSRQ